jgi:putative transposase
MVDAYRVSVRRASVLVGLSRAYFYYQPHPRDDLEERPRIREIAEAQVRYGMWRIHTLSRREGCLIYYKNTQWIYCEEGLNLRRKRPWR